MQFYLQCNTKQGDWVSANVIVRAGSVTIFSGRGSSRGDNAAEQALWKARIPDGTITTLTADH